MSCCSNHKSQKIGSEVKVDKEKPKSLLGKYLHKIDKKDTTKNSLMLLKPHRAIM